MKSDRHIILYTLLKKYKDEVELLKSKLKNTNEVACFISNIYAYTEHFYSAGNLDTIKEKYKAIVEHFLEYNCALCYICGYISEGEPFQEAYFILITDRNIDENILGYLNLKFVSYKIISVDNKIHNYWGKYEIYNVICYIRRL